MALSGGKLYASDIDKLVEIDPKSGTILAKYEAPGATFLNDVTVDAGGNVYVSDSNTSTIWRLAGGKLEKWLEGPELKFPNGLKVKAIRSSSPPGDRPAPRRRSRAGQPPRDRHRR
ncbi:MAG: hypothetical protein WDN31_00555 [Hyphomicrobium sp.]